MIKQTAPFPAMYTADPMLVDAAVQACALTGTKCIVGRVATGDQFVGDPETKKAIQLKCNPDCVEMEGAALGQVAMRNGVPFVIIRAMSDNSDVSVEELGAEHFDASEYVKTSSAILIATIEALKTLE